MLLMKHHPKFGISFQLKVPTQKDPNEMITFRKLLLNRCQREFERDKTQEVDFANMHQDIENATSVRSTTEWIHRPFYVSIPN